MNLLGIKLLVIAAIIAIGLTAGTTIIYPIYKTYVIKNKVATALPFLVDYADKFYNDYKQAGTMPKYFDTVLQTFNSGPINEIAAFTPTKLYGSCGKTSVGNCMYVYATFNTKEIKAADFTDKSRLVLYIFASEDGAKFYCGTYTYAILDMQEKYLPKGCIYHFYNESVYRI